MQSCEWLSISGHAITKVRGRGRVIKLTTPSAIHVPNTWQNVVTNKVSLRQIRAPRSYGIKWKLSLRSCERSRLGKVSVKLCGYVVCFRQCAQFTLLYWPLSLSHWPLWHWSIWHRPHWYCPSQHWPILWWLPSDHPLTLVISLRWGPQWQPLYIDLFH